jgi:predicted transcriptional regulator YdeE
MFSRCFDGLCQAAICPVSQFYFGAYMKIISRSLIAVVFILQVTGCSSTGGVVGGLVPAPKLTQGELSEGRYLAKDKSFSVDSPFEKESNAYTYMAIAEDFSLTENRLQFSSSVVPAEVYRVNIFKNVGPQENIGDAAFSQYRQFFEDSYKTSFEGPKTEEITVEGVQYTLNTYSQHIPERSSLGRKVQELDVLHTCLYLAKGDNAAFICVNRIASGKEGSTDGSEERVQRFIKSFRLE